MVDSSNPTSHRLRVIHVVLSLECGGLERIVLNLVRDGHQLGQRLAVLCLERPGVLAREAESLGARILCAKKPPGLQPALPRRIEALLKQVNPHVVHTHQVGALFYAAPAACQARIPILVHTEHGKHYAMRLRTRLLGRLSQRHVARFFCVSRDIAAEVTKYGIVPRRKVYVLPNGIDTDRFCRRFDRNAVRESLGIPSSAWIVGTVGRLDEIKRQDSLIRAFAKLSLRVPEAHLLLVGDGPQRGYLHSVCEQFAVGKSVHFVGYQPRPERYLQIMDAFALTSRAEGMPLVILEAWAAGIPVVASNVAGIGEMINHGHTGMIYEPNDDAALVEALYCLRTDDRAAKEMAESARHRVESLFTARRMAAEYQRHYFEILASRAHAAYGRQSPVISC